MKRQIVIYILVSMLFVTCNDKPTNSSLKIAIGSCYNTSLNDNSMWKEVVNTNPDLWIWLGDIIYADTYDMAFMKQKYDVLKQDIEYQKLLNSTNIIGIWDDHDYGINDGGKSYSKKKESKELLLDFLDVDKSDEVNQHDGIYNSYVIGKGEKTVKIILLDTRYFRDDLEVDTISDERYKVNQNGDILGEEQWKWLEDELNKNEASVHIIASGYQVIPWEAKYEKWSVFPTARKRLFDMLQKTKPNKAFLLSGDRHISEVSKLDLKNLDYPLYEFTSSGITHTWSKKWPEQNSHRVTELVIEKSFGIINIEWVNQEPNVTFEMRGQNDSIFAIYKPKFQ